MRTVIHICCGVCAAGAASTLLEEGHDVRGLFYNPNIHPRDEYLRRLSAAQAVAAQLHFTVEVPAYQPRDWSDLAAPLADAPEGGARCEVCYRLRLGMTAAYAKENGFDAFTTTLTVGPRKRADAINRIGKEIGGDLFLARDFKKKDGFKRAVELAARWNLYRQNYCGCEFSLRAGISARHQGTVASPPPPV